MLDQEGMVGLGYRDCDSRFRGFPIRSMITGRDTAQIRDCQTRDRRVGDPTGSFCAKTGL
jgi:hypothetical protein